MSNRHHMATSAFAIVLIAAGTSETVAAQGVEPDARVADIIVTAQKRDERLIDLPISISAFSADFLKSRNISSLEDAARFVPNTRIDFGQGSQSDNRVTIRGLTSVARNTQPGIDPNVSFYVDGVYLQRPEQLNLELVDIERIEVLRGPQGTLYGKNSTVGAVNIITQTPSLAESRGTIDLQVGSFQAVRTRANLQTPLVPDVLALSLSGFFSDNGGLRTNAVDGADVADLRRYGFRGKLHAEPSERLTVTLGADFQSDRTNSSVGDLLVVGFEPIFLFLPPPTPAPTPGNVFDRTVQKTPDAEQNSVNSWGGFLDLSYGFDAATLSSITGYRGFSSRNFLDLDFSEEPYFRSGRDNDQWQWSQEVKLVSTAGDRLDWLVGAYFYRANLRSDLQTNVDDATLLGLPPGFGGAQQLAETELDVDSQALFGQVGFRLIEALKITVGARFEREHRDFLTSQTVGSLFGDLAGFQPFPPTRFKRTEHDFSLMGSISYSLSPDANLYATYAEGSKSGGFNGGGLSGSETSLDPERLEFGQESAQNYEIGVKGLLFERQLSVAISAFLIEFHDLQVTIFDAPEIRTTNAARARSSGVELELAGKIDRLQLLGSAGYNVAEYRSYPNGPLPGGTFGDRSGTTLANAPRWQLAGSASYTAPISASVELMLGADAFYTSSQDLDSAGDPRCRQTGYGLLNARTGIRTTDQRWELQGWARNLTDTRYLVNCGLIGSIFGGGPGLNRLVGTYLGVPGEPRTFGLLARYRF